MDIKLKQNGADFYKKSLFLILFLLFMVSVFTLRVSNLNIYPYHEDEILSISVLQSIVETGFPFVGDGGLYWRSLIGHYLMAVPLFFLEISPFSTRLISILLSVFLLPIIVTMGKRTGSFLPGFFAAAFLGFSAFENLFSSMARFYLPFQFFFVAAVWAAGDFFIEKKPFSGYLLLLFSFGAIGTHLLSVELIFAVGIAAALGNNTELLKKKVFWLSVIFLGTWFFLNNCWAPSGSYTASMAIPLHIGGLEDKTAFLGWFRDMAPFCSVLYLVGMIIAWREKNDFCLHYGMTFFLCLLFLSIIAPADNPRYMANFFPLAIVVSGYALFKIPGEVKKIVNNFSRSHAGFNLKILAVLTLLVSVMIFWENPNPSFAFGTNLKFIDQKRAHDFIVGQMAQGDELISIEPAVTGFYLKKSDPIFLRESYDSDSKTYQEFSEEDVREFPGKIIDSPEDLLKFLKKTRSNVWLYANWKIVGVISPEMDKIIRRNFLPLFSENETYVLFRPKRRSS